MSGALTLAAAISNSDRDGLLRLVHRRSVVGAASVETPLDLARSLLRPESIKRGLSRADRAVLHALRTGTAPAAVWTRALELGLAGVRGEDPVAPPEIAEVLAELLAAGEDPELTTPGPAADPTAAAPGSAWSEQAFDLVRAVSAMLRFLRERPAKLRANGRVTAGAVRQLAEGAGEEPDAAQSLLDLARSAGLAALVRPEAEAPSELRITEGGLAWLDQERPERWLTLAAALLRSMPEELTEAQDVAASAHAGPEPGWDLAAEAVFPWWFPLAAPETRAGVLTCGRLTVRAGLSVAGHLSEAGRVLRDGSPADALALAHAAFPTQIDKLYVQPDLSVIAPGPLRPGIESGLLRFARAEQSGLASTYRVDAVSLETALSRGLSAADIRTFLTEHSLTGIPQPLDYLISDVESRHGSIRVAEAPAAEGLIRSIVHTAEPAQLAALLVDSGLRHLGLAQLDATSATSRFRPEQLRGALREARIPVVPAGGAEAEAPAPAPVPAAAAPATVPDPAAELVDRVLSASQGSVESDTIERTLQLAVRDRTRLRVTVSASGQERTFLLLPTGLSNGRLRGVDAAAEVERTLPLAQITAIEPPS